VFPIKNKTSIVLLFGVVLGFHLTLGSAIVGLCNLVK